ncbi:hypothetical protein [uncultured Prevotella sp.]|uniref:hypothetical protein n=1 Tax=uncultured Prevotella sp. TaxID=159272 RepID=UPI0027E28832|nr:hypothetical protein [uncultured Prevotella sp.]
MNNTLTTVALRYRALYLDIRREDINLNSEATAPVMALVARLKENGFCLSEELLHALNAVSADTLAEITKCINNVMGVNLNWAPLVKKWNVPTDENRTDHLLTLFTNLLGGKKAGFKGTTLSCGHFIPEGTFPLERYNGCPFCGTPFRTANFVYKGQGSKLKELRLFTNKDMQNVFASLLASPTPLDATQKDSLEKLLTKFALPEDVQVAMKETAMLVVKTLISHDKAMEAAALLKTPTDILRYLWYEKTGLVQIVEPKTLVAHARRMYYHVFGPLDMGADAAVDMKQKLKLKYNRKACLRVALWMNSLPMTARQAAENMNPKRGMWVRMIRALRMGEYSRKKGMEHLAEIIDVFYNQSYSTWQGRVDKARIENDADKTLGLLKERPGLFARGLFATMLRFGSKRVLAAFDKIADKLPARLLLSLGNAAESYFDFNATRLARPITGGTVSIESNKLLALYNETERQKMASDVMDVYKESMVRRFAAKKTEAKTIYIDPALYKIPVGVGDRATTIQDTSCALMGTRFKVEGDAVRLFLQWGKGLHAQPLDMDLSCRITFDNYTTAECAFYNLSCVGAKHSGDIRSIPEMVGTAEYIELSMPDLLAAKAKYVMFTCNAYSCGTLSPNLVVGWMDSAYPMQLSEETGVTYDPSCVQHMVRISESNLSKGLVFGVLDVEKREIVWLEMPFTSQTLQGADSVSAEVLLNKLEAKLTIGELLDWKAMAQNLEPVVTAQEADEAYTYEWALNPADVARLLNQEG